MGGSASFGCQKVLGFEKKKQQTNPESESLTTINHNALENIQSFTRDACYKSITFFVFKKKMQLISRQILLSMLMLLYSFKFHEYFFREEVRINEQFWTETVCIVCNVLRI